MIDACGNVSAKRSLELASTLTGASSLSTRKMVSKLYPPMSPSEPPPKSYQPRQTNGTYARLNGRSGAGPSQRFQSKPSGTGCVSAGRSIACGQNGRLDQFIT